MIRKSIHTIEEVLSQALIPTSRKRTPEGRKIIDGDCMRMDSHRYWVFKLKGTECVECHIQGKYFAKEKSSEKDNSYHFNLYAINNEGKEVLMTKDHIMPKSKGGKDHIDNYQPMCIVCNMAKADKLPDEYNGGQKVNCS
jgi:5-methylcytosine-specific restriction endonuclease McrA